MFSPPVVICKNILCRHHSDAEDLSALIAATPEEQKQQVADPLTIFQEREILLKAALQMLDQDECLSAQSGGSFAGGQAMIQLHRENSSRMWEQQATTMSGNGGTSSVPKSILKRGI